MYSKQAKKTFVRILFLRDQSLATKLLVYSALLVVVPMCVIGIISYQRAANVLERESRQFSWQIIEQVNTHVEYYVNDFEISILKILNSTNMNNYIKMKSQEEIDQSHIRDIVEQELRNAAYSRSDISNITIVLDGIETIDTIDNNFKHPENAVVNEYWYSTIPYTSEPKIFTRTLQWGDRKEQVISIARRLVSPMTLKPIGMIVMDVNFKRFQEIAEKVNIGHFGSLYIIDSEGHYVYHPDLFELGNSAHFEKLNDILNGENNSFVTSRGPKELLTYSHSSFLGWTLVTSIPYSELIQGTEYIRRTIASIVMITLAIAYLLGFGFVGSIVRPVRRLYQYMRRVESGDFTGHIVVESKDEIGMLVHGFNTMVSRLQGLMDEIYFSKLRETELALRHREIELKALQSQMNPHFLYNTLETIRGMALEHSQDDISSITSSMARLLRYNLKNKGQKVALEEEMRYAEIYLRIQKYRFEHRLVYEMNIPEWAKQQLVPKFSIQPVVENSIIHGIEPVLSTIKITISAIRNMEDNSFIVRIQDTGVGISEQTLQNIRRSLEQRDAMEDGTNIGIINVHRRIRLLFGECYGISIESKVEHGVVVDIKLPLVATVKLQSGGPSKHVHDHAG
ncbi:sensor histidine kinase [Paenibacillus aceris]|uniref:Two-component system sensor histidine kinase YesM n=2 Tax=Paenibacillus aceris TaxID=869555 RepID=A0ABS4HY38_9BACL|nr:sensor histidine kinase [Paenibacillus aceris]MBP1963251.1 two-component system sensor histidine kinase YesM [Paenibacillus aceris]